MKNNQKIKKIYHHHYSESARIIPRHIFQTFKIDDVPFGMYEAAKSWWVNNEDCTYNFYDDEMCREFIKLNFDSDLLQCYDLLPMGAFRADIWRYCILYVHGGIYADIDTICKMPMDNLIDKNDEFIIAHDAIQTKLFNAFICSSKEHPVIKNILQEIPKILLSKDMKKLVNDHPSFCYDITGPGGIAKSVISEFSFNANQIFNPGTYNNGKCKIKILKKIHYKPLWTRRVMVGLKTVLLCKYPGYFEDLKQSGGSHWQKGQFF